MTYKTYFVVLEGGAPRLKDGATMYKYKTRERAEREARRILPYRQGQTVAVAELSYVNITEVTA